METVSQGSLLLFLSIVAAVAAAGIAAAWYAWGRRARAALVAALAIGVWLAVSYAVAASGALQDFSALPPPFLLFFVLCTGATTALAFSRVGTRLIEATPTAGLIGYQGFRIAVEGFLARLYHEGVIPVQMTYEGHNFDIVTGVTALALALYCARTSSFPRRLVLAWSVLGLLLLVNIVGTAILAAPTPLRVFHYDPPNTFVAFAPFVWLPTFLVQAAWLGHLLAFRLVVKAREP